MTYPQIVILKEKHADWHYIAKDKKELSKIFAGTIRRRAENNFYGTPRKPELDPEYASLTPEQIAALPKDLREKVEKVIWVHKKDMESYEEELLELEYIQRIVDAPSLEEAAALTAPDGYGGEVNIALAVSRYRRGYSYEGYEIEQPESIEDLS